MTERKLNMVEGIGLILILFSFLIQLVENDIENEIREAQFYQTQVKMDKLWGLVGKDFVEKDSGNSKSKYEEYKELDNDWQYYSQDKKYLDDWKRGAFYDGISNSRIWLFLIGSLILVIPKFLKKN